MKYPISFCSAEKTNVEVLKYSEDGYNVPLAYGLFSAIDLFPSGDPIGDDWTAENTAQIAFLGKDCLKITGPTVDDWDQSYVIYEPKIMPTPGGVVTTKLFANHASVFALGLQEFDFTVDNPSLPTSWTAKLGEILQNPLNSTYVVFEGGYIKIVRGGPTGQTISKVKSWKISETGALQLITVSFVFTTTGYHIYVGQGDVTELIHQEIRSTLAQPAHGYCLVANVYSSDAEIGFTEPNFGYATSGYIRKAYIDVLNESVKLQANTLEFQKVLGYMTGSESGTIDVQFPDYSAVWYTLASLPTCPLILTGKVRHRVDFKLSGDIALKHQVFMSEVV